MEKSMIGKVAIVTGGSYGIGQSTAIALSKRGVKVVIADIIEDPFHQTLNSIVGAGGEAIFIRCDVSIAKEVQQLIEQTITSFGRLDFAFNNAGIEGINAKTHECSEENWDKTIAVNLKGVWLCMKYEIPEMLKHGKGVIVNCASIAGLKGFPGLPAYVISKHGIIGLTKTAALEYAKDGIRVNAVCPGVIHTPMIDRLTKNDPQAAAQYTAMEPIGRMGYPDEIAEAVVWLFSEAASFVTGTSLTVDGGIMA
ncbi:SDR family oxidoreductase [Flavihumibacter fluvii]|uniref:SDR family oxidoreductase n=1 Tax=Flavihumibacter fluvii TaxID=2838157 RepID=UPI001BDF5E7D|nr:SDR family oxidoreductase [Flavihumibacter fluvii]ULQ53819.1 SDR family oxidoreductase [Flavihumibacter fluvii]